MELWPIDMNNQTTICPIEAKFSTYFVAFTISFMTT